MRGHLVDASEEVYCSRMGRVVHSFSDPLLSQAEYHGHERSHAYGLAGIKGF